MDRDQVLELVEPNRVEVYLLAHDWEALERTPSFSVWRSPADDAQLFVPLDREFGDYKDRLWDLVKRLGQLEGLDLESTVNGLRYALADLVRIRLVGPRVAAGELPLGDASDLFSGTRDLMLAAACSAIEHRPSWGPKKPERAMEYLEDVKLGQTERGSYVVTVISEFPAEEQIAISPVHIDAPFERRVTSQLHEALGAAGLAASNVLREEQDVSAFEETVESGVSANLCEALAKIGAEDAPATVEVGIDWAGSMPRPTVGQLPEARYEFDPGSIEVLKEAGLALRKHGPFEGAVVEGVVARLIRGSHDEIGKVVIEGLVNGQEHRNVHVELPDNDYATAIAAHENRESIHVEGTLVKKGKAWVLQEPGQLRLERDE